jgi:hypothetical protein
VHIVLSCTFFLIFELKYVICSKRKWIALNYFVYCVNIQKLHAVVVYYSFHQNAVNHVEEVL